MQQILKMMSLLVGFAVHSCRAIGSIVSLLCLVKMYGRFKQFRAAVHISWHTLAECTAAPAPSKSCWNGRRQSSCVARFCKILRKWQRDLGSVRFAWRKRSNMIPGGVFLVLITFQSGSIVCAQEVEEQKQQQLDLPYPSATINAVVVALAIVLATSYVLGRPIYYSYIFYLLQHKYKIRLLRQTNLDLGGESMELQCAHVRLGGGGWGV
eukprot:SAG11_NODE_2345_length_3487_cov_1.677981_1_plen_209_part_10